jgi:hypothetical protein
LVSHRGCAGRSVFVGIHVTKPSRASLGAPLSWPKPLLSFRASPVQARTMRFRRFATSDGHRRWSSDSWSPVTEDTGGSSRQFRCRLASRRGSLRCHQIHPGGCDSTGHGDARKRRSMTCEDPGPTAPAIARAAGQTFWLPSPPRSTRGSLNRRLLKPSPGCIPRRSGLGHLQPTFFRFSKTCTRLVPHSLPDPRGGRMKPRVTPRWPRFGSNAPLSSPDRARLRWLSPPEQGRSPR